jgi:putative drug exporter of the RND superfamily
MPLLPRTLRRFAERVESSDMFKHLGRFTAAHPWMICGAWLLAAAGIAAIAPPRDGRVQDDDIRFLPDRCDSVRGYHLLEQAFPQDVFASRAIFALERRDSPLSAADLDIAAGIAEEIGLLAREDPTLQIGRVCSPNDPFIGKRLLSTDGRCALVQVSLGTPYTAVQTRSTVEKADAVARRRLAAAGPNAPELYITGPAGFGRDLIAAGADSLESTTLATVILVVVILLAVYRAPLLALVPLVTIGGSVFVALKLLALCTLIPGFYLVNISRIFAVVMLYGAGTDYCLFLISRYREELADGHGRKAAVERSVAAVGGALSASAGTVICGLGLMVLAEFTKVRCGGPAIAVGLAVALIGSLTLAPALLQLLGGFAFWPMPAPRRVLGLPRETLWDRLSRFVVDRPMVIWGVAALALLPLALLGTRVHANYRTTSELSASCGSVRGLAAIQRHFTAGEVGPVTVLLESALPWDSKDGQELVAHLSQGFARLDNVAEVRSATQPLGEAARPAAEAPDPRTLPLRAVWHRVVQGLNDQVQRTARPFYLATVTPTDGPPRYVARLDVVLRTDPFDPRSMTTLDELQYWLREEMPSRGGFPAGVRAETYGVTVSARDLASVTESDRFHINVLVTGGVFLILLALVRRPWLAGYLLATVLFSYVAALGATTLFAHFVFGRPLGEVDWRVPFFLFTILVAVGEDYNIFLIDRMLHERKKYGAGEGTRRALAHTGGTITSCGIIMAGTFATLMLGGLSTLVQIGFALAFGVLLDTFVVRPFLVPALTVWIWLREEKAEALLRQRVTPTRVRIDRRKAG